MRRSELTTFLLILLLAAGLRLAGITSDSLWLDESYQSFSETIGQHLPNFTQVVDKPYLFKFGPPAPVEHVLANFRTVDPLCPPLYAVLLNRWLAVCGESDFACRSLSTVLSLLSLSVIYAIARFSLNSRVALIAALLQAVSPFDIYYAQESRMYELEMLAAAVSCGCLLLLLTCSLRRGQPSPSQLNDSPSTASGDGARCARLLLPLTLATYIISTWALINSHYTALFIVAFQGLFSSYFCLRHRKWGLLGILIFAWTGIALLWLPWFGLFRQAAAIRTASFYVSRAASWWWPMWALIIRIPFNWIVFLSGKQVVAWACPVYLTSLAFLLMAGWESILKNANCNTVRLAQERWQDASADTGFPPDAVHLVRSDASRRAHWAALEPPLQFFWAWLVIPPVLVWMIDVAEGHRLVEIARYLMACAPAVYILSAYGASTLPAVRRWLPILLFAHCTFALGNNTYAHTVGQREPWKEMAVLVEQLVAPDEPLLVSQYYDIVCLDRYLSCAHLQFGVSPALGKPHLNQVLLGRKSFWLLTAQEGEAIKKMIPVRYKLSRQIDLRHALHLRLYELSAR